MIATKAPSRELSAWPARGFRNIVLAINKKTSPRALEVVSTIAKPGSSRVLVLHLQERMTYPGGRGGGTMVIETFPEAVEFATRMQSELRELGVVAEVAVGREISGHEAEQIVRAAGEFQANVIVAGSRPRSWLYALLNGSTTRDLVRKSQIPVLLVK